MIRFTIATCTYNAESDLPPTLSSVLEQDYESIEHLIIDGASKDKSLQILSDYQEENDRQKRHLVRIISEPDSGLYYAMNKALREAKGDYILFLNAGDRFHAANTLTLVAKTAEGENVLPGVIYGNTDIVDAKGHFLHPRHLQPPERLTWKSFRKGMLVCHQAFFASIQLTKDCPYNLGYRFSADYDWCIRIMKLAEEKGLPLTNVHAVIADYKEGGMTIKNHRKSLLERLRIMSNHYGVFQTVFLHIYFIFRSLQKEPDSTQ